VSSIATFALACAHISTFFMKGDGSGDIAVGASQASVGGTEVGVLWILFLDRSGTVIEGYQQISATAGNFTGVLDSSDNFATAVAHVGDVNGAKLT
jgi:hypothetical protein